MRTIEDVSSECILNEAISVWKSAKQEHRDASIRVGQLLTDYVIARLREANGLPEAERLANKLTRERIIEDAARRLRMKTMQANIMIRVAKVVELFGDPGTLSFSSIRGFMVFVQRKKYEVTRGRKLKSGQVNPSDSEAWEIKPTTGSSPVDIYKRAVEEEWGCKRILEVLAKEVTVERRGGRIPSVIKRRSADPVTSSKSTRERIDNRLPPLASIAQNADPRDLADMLMEVIAACPRADELKKILLRMLK